MSFFDIMGREYVETMNTVIHDAPVRGFQKLILKEGRYQMFVQAASLREPYRDGEPPYFIIELTLLTGDHKGESIFKRYPLEPDEMHMSILKSDLQKLGVQLDNIVDLENSDEMEQILDEIVEVDVKDKRGKNGKTYQNYYFRRVVGHMGNAPGSQMDDDGLPWA